MPNDAQRLEQLFNGSNQCVYITTYEERYALDVVRNAAVSLRRDMWIWSAAEGVRHGLELFETQPSVNDTAKPDMGLKNLCTTPVNSISVALDLSAYLSDNRVCRILRELIKQFEDSDRYLVLIDSKGVLPEVIKSHMVQFELSLPDEQELEFIVRETLIRIHKKTPLEIGITRSGLDVIVKNLRGLTRRQAERIIIDAVVDDHKLSDEDINTIIAGKRRILHSTSLLEYVQTPLDLSEIGGMKNLKKWLVQRKDAFSNKARDFGLQAPRGVLMLGVQGAGKSLCAKAIATAWQQPLLRLDPSVLYASYIGESEHNLREALRQVEVMSPVVLWIDEIEKAFASAASRSADGGLSQRMFGTLLTWLQEHQEPVFVVATANDIEALPPELLRKGRFDEIFFVGLPDHETRKQIFSIHLAKRGRDKKGFDLDKLASVSKGYSGAEIEQAVIAGLYNAFEEGKQLSTSYVEKSLKCSPPLSVTMAERVEFLLQWAEGRCVPVD